MASEFTLYSSLRKYLLNGTINLESDTLKLALVTSAYSPNVAHAVLADVMSSPSPEVVAVASPDNGYPMGGKALTGQTVTKTDSPSAGKFDADDVIFTALTATFRYGVLYAAVTRNGIEDPLIGYVLYDTTPADITISGLDWINQWSPNGVITD